MMNPLNLSLKRRYSHVESVTINHEIENAHGFKRLAVFCGSCSGSDLAFGAAAEALGSLLARENIGLVYGGGDVGLMGKVATAVLRAGGHVTGVMPKFLMEKELGKIEVQDLRIVTSMHERKALMAELVDGFIALPGGFGTLEEFCEILTWSQLGLHVNPFGLLNVSGFYDHFLAFIDTAVACQFIRPVHREILLTACEPQELLAKMRVWKHHQPLPWPLAERATGSSSDPISNRDIMKCS